jgi:hypothetical protein
VAVKLHVFLNSALYEITGQLQITDAFTLDGEAPCIPQLGGLVGPGVVLNLVVVKRKVPTVLR